MARVLVTGANGFIGSHLVRALLAQGDQVACLVRSTSTADRLEALRVRLIRGDLTEPAGLSDAIAGVEVVYHAAGCVRALGSEQFYLVNGEGGYNLIRACAEQSTPPVVVWVSSLAAAGPTSKDRLRTETDPLVQVSHYARSKRQGELAAEQFADRVPITIVRPPIVLGQSDPLSLPMFRSVAWFHVHVVHGLGRVRFSVIHIADLVEVLIRAARGGTRLRPTGSDPTGSAGYYFAACPEHPSYAELGRMIGAALGHRRTLVIPTPPPYVWLLGISGEAMGRLWGSPFSLNLDKAREIRAGSWLCSPQRAIDDLGFSVTTPLADRLRETVGWYREHGWL